MLAADASNQTSYNSNQKTTTTTTTAHLPCVLCKLESLNHVAYFFR